MPLTGSIRVPSDKSISHRAVLLAGLAQGASCLRDVLPSADVRMTIAAVRALGAHVDFECGPHGLHGEVRGIALAPDVTGPLCIDCGNSGTTARLLMGVLAGLGIDATVTGDASLSRRPMRRVMDPLVQMGAAFESEGGHLPVRVCPDMPLHASHLAIGQASAQVKSAILLAGMQAHGLTSVTEPEKSRDHTELLLPAFGVDVRVEGLTSSVEGPAILHAHDMSVPADPSSAAFVMVAATLVPGSDVLLEQVALNPTRTGAFEVLRRMGALVEYEDVRREGCEPVGNVRVVHVPHLRAVRITSREIPTLVDEVPILALAAAMACGETVFESVGELRVKESDRLAAIIDGLGILGVRAYADADDLHVIGRGGARLELPDSVAFTTHGDHRLAMTWHLAGISFGFDAELDDRDCVDVSWPDFFADVESLMG